MRKSPRNLKTKHYDAYIINIAWLNFGCNLWMAYFYFYALYQSESIKYHIDNKPHLKTVTAQGSKCVQSKWALKGSYGGTHPKMLTHERQDNARRGHPGGGWGSLHGDEPPQGPHPGRCRITRGRWQITKQKDGVVTKTIAAALLRASQASLIKKLKLIISLEKNTHNFNSLAC
jgi:hypothetical protein